MILNEMERELIKNQSYIAIPFTYSGEKPFEAFMSEKAELFAQKNIMFGRPQEVKKDPRLNHVSELFEQVCLYVDEQIYVSEAMPVAWVKSEIYYFPTNVGFLVLKLEFDIEGENCVDAIIGILQDLVEYIELEDQEFKSGLEKEFFDKIYIKTKTVLNLLDSEKGNEKSCLLFHSFGSELNETKAFELRHINKLGTLSLNNMLKTYEEVETKLSVDSMNDYYMSVKCLAMSQDLDMPRVIKESSEDRESLEKVLRFKKNYLNNSFLLFLMLHHERQVLLNCKRNTIGLIKTDGKQVARIKSTILDCLSCYSFETVSDDAITQLVYEKYKGILKLPLLEENMSNLIFKLDDEIGKKKEAKITKLTIVFSLLGAISVLGSALDIVQHIVNFVNFLNSLGGN